jgi:general secretion pathway protein N
MKNALKGVALGLIAYLLTLIYTIPAHLITPYLPSDVHLIDAGGTVWNGQAGNLQLKEFDFGEVMWHIQPLYLAIGQARANFSFHQTHLNGQGDVTIRPHSLGLEDLHISGKTDFINPYISAYGASLDGEVKLNISSLWAHQTGPEQADGHLILQNAQLLTPTELALGDIEVKLEQRGETAVATLKNKGNTLNLSGTANINPGWRYTTNLTIAPTPSTPDNLKQSLTLLGRTDTRGAVALSNSGIIPIFDWLPHLQREDEGE